METVTSSRIRELSRKDRIWACTECGKEFPVAPVQCSCGAGDKVFIEKDNPIAQTGRKTYKVTQNIIYEGEQINKGEIISLVTKDRISKNLIARRLVEEIPDEVKKGTK